MASPALCFPASRGMSATLRVSGTVVRSTPRPHRFSHFRGRSLTSLSQLHSPGGLVRVHQAAGPRRDPPGCTVGGDAGQQMRDLPNCSRIPWRDYNSAAGRLSRQLSGRNACPAVSGYFLNTMPPRLANRGLDRTSEMATYTPAKPLSKPALYAPLIPPPAVTVECI